MDKSKLRSANWFGRKGKDGFIYRTWMKNQGIEEELPLRRKAWKQTEQIHPRGYVHLYQTHVEQAHLGADMDFLKGGSGSKVSRDSH